MTIMAASSIVCVHNRNEPAVLQILLGKSGAAINCANKNGRTALHIAVFKQHAECVQVLLKFNADVNKQVNNRMAQRINNYSLTL